jgi:hypothetical protein
MTDQEQVWKNVVTLLRSGKRSVTIIAGAGISIPSGLPSGRDIVKKIVDLLLKQAGLLNHKLPEKIRDHVLDIRPEVVLDIIQSIYRLHSPQGSGLPMARLLSGFKDADPNEMHYFLAHLLRRGLASSVITTNYDTLIEKAFATVSGLDSRLFWELPIVSTTNDLPKLSSRKPYLFKIHGSLESRPKAPPLFAAQDFASVPARFLKAFQRTLKNKHLLVLGYSGSDDFSLKPLFVSTPSTRRIFWIEHLVGHSSGIIDPVPGSAREIITSRDRRFQYEIPTPDILKKVAAKGSVLLATHTDEFVRGLSQQLGFPKINITSSSPMPFVGLEQWVKRLPAHVACLCLLSLGRKVMAAEEMRRFGTSLVHKHACKISHRVDVAQLHFEYATLCEDSGDQSTAQKHFALAHKILTEEWQIRRSIPDHVREFAHRVQMMWGFSLKDQALRRKFSEHTFKAAHTKFSESSKPFGRNLMAQIEAPWVWKDLAGKKEGQRCSLLKKAVNDWAHLLDPQSGLWGLELGKVHNNLAWAYFDLGDAQVQWKDKIKNWKRSIKHSDKAVKVFTDVVDVVGKGRAMRTGGILCSKIAGALLQNPSLQREGMRPYVLLKTAADWIEDASRLFVALGDHVNQAFTLAAKAWLAYAKGDIDLGDQHCKALPRAGEQAPLTQWGRDVWIPKERVRLRNFRSQMVRGPRDDRSPSEIRKQ